MATHNIKDYILYYRNKLDRCKDDEDMVIETIQKLGKPAVNAEVVQETGILRQLHKLCKEKGKVSETARALLHKWKHLPSARDKPTPEEQPRAPAKDISMPIWSNHVGLDREAVIHPAHRNQDTIHPERGSTKRKDPFPPAAEPKRLNPAHHSHRDAKHPTLQKDHTTADRFHRSTNHLNSSLDRSKTSATNNDLFPPDVDSSRHSTARRHLFAPDVDSSRHLGTKKDAFALDGYSSALDGFASRHPPVNKDSFAPDGHSSSGSDGHPRHPSRKAPEGYSATDGYSRHQQSRKDSLFPDGPVATGDGYSRNPPRKDILDGHINTDGYSRHPKKDDFSRHQTARKDRDAESSRHGMAKKDHFASDIDTSRHSSARKELFPSDSDSSRHFTARHFGERDASRHTRKDHLLDGDSARHPIAKKDHFTPEGNSAHHNNVVRSETTSHRGDPKARKELFATDDNDFHRGRGSRYSSAQRDGFVSETDDICNDGGFNKDGESRHPKKDYFAPDDDFSEHNGVTSSQENNPQIDIDSLSNPNLNIDTGHLNTSDDSEHASPTKRARAREPYYIEMQEGMFRAIKNTRTPINDEERLKFYDMVNRYIKFPKDTWKFKHTADRVEPSYKREEKDRNNSTLTMSPRESSSDCDNWNAKNGPSDPKIASEKSVRAKSDPKRKSDSPCKGKDKRIRPDSSVDPKVKVKKEPGSPKNGPDFSSDPKLKIKKDHLSPKMTSDSSSDHRLKIKKEPLSPSQMPKSSNHCEGGHQSNCDRNKSAKIQDSSPETSAMHYMSSSKRDRRVVYSGKKSVQEISSLRNMCLQVLRKHLDHIRCPTKVPYQSLQPLLETLNPSQLAKVEEHNKFLIAHTNSLWKQHYHRDHRSQVVVKNESDIVWKDEYNRAQEIKRKKLRNITAGINAAASKAKPDRQAKVIETVADFGRRGARNAEIPVTSSKLAVPTPVAASRSSSSPTPKPVAAATPKTLPSVNSKPKETKHLAAHKPVKKVVAPLMNKVKKSMAIVYSRQK